jgi:hypothetical protein
MHNRTGIAKTRQSGRTAPRAGLIAVEALVALAAIFGVVGLISNNAIHMEAEWLDGTPFNSWVWPGIFLLIVVALPMALAAVAEIGHNTLAYPTSLVAGAAQMAWIIVQWAVMQRYFFLQPVMLVAGSVVIALAWLTHRGTPVFGGRHRDPLPCTTHMS